MYILNICWGGTPKFCFTKQPEPCLFRKIQIIKGLQAKEGFESRHNLKYWQCEEYLGIGAAAHSFVDGKRFYYERSIADFVDGKPPVDDGEGGDEEEYIMLTLRLKNGLNFAEFETRFGKSIPDSIINEAKSLERHNLVTVDSKKIALTKPGFLLSNSVICRLLENIG